MKSSHSQLMSLDDILITEELSHRALRPPELLSENHALHTLARLMVEQPQTMLKSLVTMALQLCRAGSAGVSLLEVTSTGEEVFRWVALTGALAAYEQGTTPRDSSPCGICLNRGTPQLFSYPERYFTYFKDARPVIVEGLVIPLIAQNYQQGTIWIVSHDDQRLFDEEDVRVMTSLADFTAAALGICQARATAEELARREQAARIEAEIANHAKDEFLATVSHELRTPMTNIKMAIQMLQLATQPAQIECYMQILKSECAREINLINDLLDFQRLEAGAVSVELERLQLQDWLTPIVKPFVERAQTHQQTLRLDLPREIVPLESDPVYLERIVVELLNNACKYTPSGGEITLALHPKRLRKPGNPASVEMIVSNSGSEIPSADLSRIFEKFYRIPRSDLWKQGGTGLGLALVEKLVKLLGGSIEAKSQAGQVMFTVELPSDMAYLAN